MNDLVTCNLAHPLGAEGARSVGLEHRDHEVEEEITLLRGHAMRLVGAGMVAGADPKNRESVAAALRPATPKTEPAVAPAPAPKTEPAAPPVPGSTPAKPARVKPADDPA
ncbi:hypothetical protein ABT352_33405 [Streptosporangium sp. NPDC000563]|uniref:hypothetical protein n=1 Tax=Streptosporangium sp. NPDC000563 TaxID=3154366 RepID=UPI00331F1775